MSSAEDTYTVEIYPEKSNNNANSNEETFLLTLDFPDGCQPTISTSTTGMGVWPTTTAQTSWYAQSAAAYAAYYQNYYNYSYYPNTIEVPNPVPATPLSTLPAAPPVEVQASF